MSKMNISTFPLALTAELKFVQAEKILQLKGDLKRRTGLSERYSICCKHKRKQFLPWTIREQWPDGCSLKKKCFKFKECIGIKDRGKNN